MKDFLKNVGRSFVCIFLLAFMTLIFGPAEIFFTNSTEFKFVFGDFGYWLIIVGCIGSVVLSIIIAILPKTVRKILLSIILAVSVAGYLQVMFFDKDLDLLGVNPEGYVVGDKAVNNIIIWIGIIVASVIISITREKIWNKLLVYVSVCLLLVQMVAYTSLFIGADESCFNYEPEGAWYLSGEKQLMVSSDKNIIVIILDFFSNQYLEPAMEKYPDLVSELNDFTYYSNTDCAYFGTFPSLPAMLSGQEVDPSILINEWTNKIWTNEKTKSFYQSLQNMNYEINVYTPDTNILRGMNDVEILSNEFSNLSNAGQDIIVDYKKLRKTMTKLSCFRLFPDYLKRKVYVEINEYQSVVQTRENNIRHDNYDFYEGLLNQGLSKEEGKNYYIFQHLMGPHIYDTGADGFEKENSTMEETVKGCMVVVGEYLRQLKELGVYDNSTIIITADHGSPRESQVAFFMKDEGERHDSMITKTSPISLRDLMATVGKAAGIDYSRYGVAVSDVSEDEHRTRKVWVRGWSDNYPKLKRYYGEGEGADNIYNEYEYDGDIYDLYKQYDQGPTKVIPMMDSYF